MKSAARLINTANASNLYLANILNNGMETWHYILVDKAKEPLFLKQMKKEHIDLTKFGKILYSGWGHTPPKEITKKVKKNS